MLGFQITMEQKQTIYQENTTVSWENQHKGDPKFRCGMLKEMGRC